jgi:hypothetical protein
LFDSHRDILNALFEVYYDLGIEYCKKYYFGDKKMEKDATERLKKKYGLEIDTSGEEVKKELFENYKK